MFVSFFPVFASCSHSLSFPSPQDKFPAVDPSRLLMRLYPYPAFLAQDSFKSVEDVLSTFGFNSFLVSSRV